MTEKGRNHMKQSAFFRIWMMILTVMILTVCILFVSCDTAAGTQGDETRGSEIGAVGTETHTDSAGKINLSLF